MMGMEITHLSSVCRNFPGIPKDLRLLDPSSHCRDWSEGTRGCAEPQQCLECGAEQGWGSGAAAEGLKGAGTMGELCLYWRFECDCAKSPQNHPKVTLWWQRGSGLLPQLSLTSPWPQPPPALLLLLFPRSCQGPVLCSTCQGNYFSTQPCGRLWFPLCLCPQMHSSGLQHLCCRQ